MKEEQTSKGLSPWITWTVIIIGVLVSTFIYVMYYCDILRYLDSVGKLALPLYDNRVAMCDFLFYYF